MMSLREHHTPLFVELGLDGERRYFEFGANEEAAVAVGSSPHAHLRLSRAGVSPVAFHLERVRDAIYVVPGYGTDVRLNAALVRSRARLTDRCVLEFQGISLSTRVLSERPDSEEVSLHTTLEQLRKERFEQPLDCATVRFAVPGLHPLQPELPTSAVALGPGSPLDHDFTRDTEQVQFFMTQALAAPLPARDASVAAGPEPVPARLEPVPARPEPIHAHLESAPAALEQTLVIERPKPLARSSVTERPELAEAPVVETQAPVFETQAIGTRQGLTVTPGLSASAPSPLEPAAPPPPAPRAAAATFQVSPPHAASPATFQVSPPNAAPARSEPQAVAPGALSLDAQTTVFETVHAPRNAPRSPAPDLSKPAPTPSSAGSKGVASLARLGLLTNVGWLARLGLLTKSKPVPVLAGALGVALLIGVGAANTAQPLTERSPAKRSGTGEGSKPSAGSTSSAGSHSSRPQSTPGSLPNTNPPPSAAARPSTSAVAPSASATPPRSLVLKAAGTAAPPRQRARNTPNDPELARAVGEVGAGRYREAAEAYSALASRAQDAEPYRTIASLLEKASSNDCKPSGDMKPFCPEVLK